MFTEHIKYFVDLNNIDPLYMRHTCDIITAQRGGNDVTFILDGYTEIPSSADTCVHHTLFKLCDLREKLSSIRVDKWKSRNLLRKYSNLHHIEALFSLLLLIIVIQSLHPTTIS